MIFMPLIHLSDSATVTATAANLGTMVTNGRYLFVSSTNCWIKQATTNMVTFVTKANFADTDYFSITYDGSTVVYEMDKTGDGVTAGRVQVDISTDTTAAQCAARARTAILANQTTLTVTDNTDGTLTITATAKYMTITENVTNAGFLIATTTAPPVTAADTSMYVPANTIITIDGTFGPQLGVLRNTADGNASLTPAKVF
jgi:hypothetical protein